MEIKTRRNELHTLYMAYTVEPLLTDTLNNGHLQTTDNGRSSKAVRYMQVPLNYTWSTIKLAIK